VSPRLPPGRAGKGPPAMMISVYGV
jgi:hypothetical protein